ncbi:MAG: 50S ribosomal protein L25, partial [Chlamydiota bacterium]|nr:50S ribosomal protein L25 [Chlamydiota bacterium]
MAEDIVLKASGRELTGKSVRRLRTTGFVPAVLYGDGKPGVSLQIGQKILTDLLRHHGSENLILKLEMDEVKGKKSATVMLRDIQVDPIRDTIMHVDFLEISLKKKIRTHVHVEALGEAIGVVQQGGVLEHALREVEIECFPTQIPENITCDVANLKIGDSINAGDLVLPEGVVILTPLDWNVFAVAAPRVE